MEKENSRPIDVLSATLAVTDEDATADGSGHFL
jgi:hypothetical protein